jgi:dienelactone hydrolase
MVVDAYRTLATLAGRPDIDPEGIAIMVSPEAASSPFTPASCYTSLLRFQRMHGPAGLRFAAHLGFYPGCWITFVDDEKVTQQPIRLFHGAEDDWTPVEPCRGYVARLCRAGADAELSEYPAAPHGFDMPWSKRQFSHARRTSRRFFSRIAMGGRRTRIPRPTDRRFSSSASSASPVVTTRWLARRNRGARRRSSPTSGP